MATGGPISGWPDTPVAAGRTAERPSYRVKNSMRGCPGSGWTKGRTTLRMVQAPSKIPRCRPPVILRLLPDQFHHQLTFGPENDRVIGVLGLKRQLGFPEVEPSRQGQAPGGLTGVCSSRAPSTTQLWAWMVGSPIPGQRAVYSWKVQVPHTSGLLRWTLVSSTAEI